MKKSFIILHNVFGFKNSFEILKNSFEIFKNRFEISK
jgi:hypothetical protein